MCVCVCMYTHVYFPAVAPPLAKAGSTGVNAERARPPAITGMDATAFSNKSLRDAGADWCGVAIFDDCCGLNPSTADPARKAMNPSCAVSFIVSM